MSGYEDRLKRIRALLDEKKLDAIVLRRNPNIAWFIGGRAHVPSTIDAACLDLVVTTSRTYVVTNVIEAPRLIAEELPAEIEVQAIPWWEGRDMRLPTGAKVGSDQSGGDRIDLGVDIEILRQSLVHEDIERFRLICTDSAVALGSAMRAIHRDDREIDVAGKISQSLWSHNLEIAFLGVAGARRAPLMRHPLPTVDPIGERVVASICAKRKGLIASVTRIATFGENESLFAHYDALLQVESVMLDATIVGNSFSSPVAAASIAYAENGFDRDEWHKHHQGGPTGYLPRDWPATLSTTRSITANQPIAWNPTAKGWKVEDTLITTVGGIEILTVDATWPSVTIHNRKRPGLLIR
jgi:Xaa-Pro aminopeptidase